MKKNVLALSIAAGLLGLAGGAHAVTDVGGATAATSLAQNLDGIGHILVVPYFTAQGANNTLLNIVNTDQTNGKAVKVRFRGAANSDDIYDFQVFMSPGDVWSANIAKGATGLSQLTTSDKTCTKPAAATLNTTPFVTARLDQTLTGDALASQTREGYIEILNMADIVPGNALFTAIKHVSGVAPCSGAAWTALDLAVDTNVVGYNGLFLSSPTTGLMANWTIINTVGAAAWSSTAVALESRAAGVAAAGHLVYWPQTSTPVAAATADNYTADPLIRDTSLVPGVGTAVTVAAAPAFAAGFYDFPDLSTAYTTTASAAGAANANGPLQQAFALTSQLHATTITNEFLTGSGIGATTDWTFAMPTRRYHVAFNYSVSGAAEGRRFTEILDDGAPATMVSGYFVNSNTTVVNRQICVTGITYKVFDREEQTPTSSNQVVISPSSPGVPTAFCGEDSVLTLNNAGATASGSLGAMVAIKDLTVPYAAGWMVMATPAGNATAAAAGVNVGAIAVGLPVLGGSYAKAIGSTGGQTFGAAWDHRFGR